MTKHNKILITIGVLSMLFGVLSDPSSAVLLGIGAGLILTGLWKKYE